MASLLRLKHAQNALRQQKKHNIFASVFDIAWVVLPKFFCWLKQGCHIWQTFFLFRQSRLIGRPLASYVKRLEALLFLFLLKSLKKTRHPFWRFYANDSEILFFSLFFHNIFYSPFFLFVQGFWQPLHFFFLLTDLITNQIDSKITSTPNALMATFHQPKISIKSEKL